MKITRVADAIVVGARVWRGVACVTRRMVECLAMLCAMASVLVAPVDAQIMFARDSAVPPSVQEFAWRVIETRCNYQSYERDQRSFWAYRVRTRRIDDGVAYSIKIVSDVTLRKREPSAFIEMTIVDGGGFRLTALTSSFITCAP